MSGVDIERTDGIATVTMNDGKANIMSAQFLGELITAVRSAADAGEIVVLRSSIEGTYSGGFDVKALATRDPATVIEMMKAGADLIHAMLIHPRPIVAAASGRIFPMGLFTLLAADYRIGDSEQAQWCLNEAQLGIVPPDYAFDLLRYRFDSNWLSRAILTADMMSAADGLAAGVFDRLASGDEVETQAFRVAKLLADSPASSLAGIKRKLRSEVADRIRTSSERELSVENYRKKYAA
ncbi:crotonase/enoyl-CoA hydratase family protein [Erythrobacter sp. GH1-10]|uniref:crotonase/enoyl-CoA hydratase family protein n=1 Tax=Erythrobacter sp. GH1-10 TaxID=3349334 RepID=UPI003878284C